MICFADILSDAERFLPQTVRATGGWTPAQIVQHIADSIEHSIDGYGVRASDDVREKARARKPKLLADGFPPGIQIPDEMSHLLPDAGVSWNDALANLRRAVQRAESEPMAADHPFLGELTADEWLRFHCRHAELHFGFLQPG